MPRLAVRLLHDEARSHASGDAVALVIHVLELALRERDGARCER
jgi:hypothetical protein